MVALYRLHVLGTSSILVFFQLFFHTLYFCKCILALWGTRSQLPSHFLSLNTATKSLWETWPTGAQSLNFHCQSCSRQSPCHCPCFVPCLLLPCLHTGPTPVVVAKTHISTLHFVRLLYSCPFPCHHVQPITLHFITTYTCFHLTCPCAGRLICFRTYHMSELFCCRPACPCPCSSNNTRLFSCFIVVLSGSCLSGAVLNNILISFPSDAWGFPLVLKPKHTCT